MRNCRFEDVGIGVTTDFYGSKNFYIADNVFIGREDPKTLMGWTGRTWENLPGFPETIRSFVAVNVLGRGHVVCYNSIANFHDGIDVEVGDSYFDVKKMQELEDTGLKPVAIDFYNNNISRVSDNAIETDPVFHNIRVLRNRCLNAAHRPLSSQVNLGGPVYFIRNIVYHAPEGGSIKFFFQTSGLIVYHNTLCAEVSIHFSNYREDPAANMHFRNNLILGQGAEKEIFYIDTFTNYSTADYDGFRPNDGVEYPFVWKSPPFRVRADFSVSGETWPFKNLADLSGVPGPRETRLFKNLANLARVTGQEKHGIIVDYDIFQHVSKPDPQDPRKVYDAKDLDFRLRPGAVAIDAGCPLPNVNGGFTGKAPDLGALETGAPEPVYGPRPREI